MLVLNSYAAIDTQMIGASVRYVKDSPERIVSKTTVLFVTRNGEIKGRFDIPGVEKGKHAILMCLDGSVFRQMLIEHAPPGTPVEIIRPDNTSHIYRYLG